MPTTSNFGWTTPADTDLVKDGAAAIRTLGNGIDTSFLDLKGGTSGQVLSKASNTDLDFTWVAQDDSNAIQNAIVDAKGDLISATAADTPARLAVGSNGTVLTADSTEATGLKWVAPSSGALTLIKTQTMGTAVSSVAVTNVFSSTYDNYLILITGGSTAASAGVGLNMQLGSTTTGYYVGGFYNYANNSAYAGNSFNNAGNFELVALGGNTLSGVIYLTSPNLAKRTGIHYTSMRMETTDSLAFRGIGFESSTTQHTDFTLSVSNSSTVTGGTIKVYGYQN